MIQERDLVQDIRDAIQTPSELPNLLRLTYGVWRHGRIALAANRRMVRVRRGLQRGPAGLASATRPWTCPRPAI